MEDLTLEQMLGRGKQVVGFLDHGGEGFGQGGWARSEGVYHRLGPAQGAKIANGGKAAQAGDQGMAAFGFEDFNVLAQPVGGDGGQEFGQSVGLNAAAVAPQGVCIYLTEGKAMDHQGPLAWGQRTGHE